jgi:aminoglycoside phosphotransferase (APT) family kinase protein
VSGAVKEALERFLAARLDARELRIETLSQQTEGFSQETFALDAALVRRDGGSETRRYVVKRAPAAGLLDPYDLEPEFAVLHALSGRGLLSPPTPWFEADPSVLARPFYVMERLPGEVPVPALDGDGRPPFDDDERAALAPQVAAELARLHAVDWKNLGIGLAPPSGTSCAAYELARWRARVEASGLARMPIVEYALGWFAANLPPDEDRSLVHGDYRTGNFLVVRDGSRSRLTGVLDLEMVHVGDPIEDLGWATSRLWRAQGPFACCLAQPEELVRMYEEASGRSVDRDRLRFYQVLSAFKMLAIMLTGIRVFREGRSKDVRMAIFDHQAPFLHVLLCVELGLLPEM